jgi:hypothetical protein
MATPGAPSPHLASLQRILADLALDGLKVLTHEYRASENGFSLVVETDLKRVRFDWDEASSILTISLPGSAEHGPWTEDARINLPGGEGLFAEIGSECLTLLE